MRLGIHYKSVFYFWALSCLPSAQVQAREVLFGKAKETLSVSFGVETLFRFPMEVKTITEAQRFEIKPANSEEPDYSVLAVKPRMKEGVADITFILSDGSVIRTQLVISNRSNLKKDSIYDFKPKDELSSTNPNLLDKREPLVISELDLMRSMIGGERVSGFEVHVLDQKIDLNPSGAGADGLSVHLVKGYIGSGLHGFVYLLKTQAKDQFYSIDLAKLAIGQPNLALLAEVDHPVIGGEAEAERQTYLRVIAKPGASSRRLVLPVAIQREDKS
jgi:hypothetical protein